MARTIEPGTLVIDCSGTEYVYGGTSDMYGMTELKFDLRNGGKVTIHTDPDQVAPASVAATANNKDPRITVRKIEPKPRSARGPWHRHVQLPGPSENTGWHKTKREAIAEAAYRLAIADWHAELDQAVEDMKADILLFINNGHIPADVPDFTTLHDYCDANELAGFCDDDRRAHWPTEDLATVQNVVDAWLKAGRQ